MSLLPAAASPRPALVFSVGMALLVASAPQAHAAPGAAAKDGPFGIYMGEPLEQLGKVQDAGAGNYVVLNPPRPNPQFELLYVAAYPGVGVCLIAAATPEFALDQDGVQVKAAVDQLADALKSKYGPGAVKTDVCTVDKAECDVSWALALQEQGVRYNYRWLDSDAAKAQGIGAVMVQAQAGTRAGSTKMVVGYTSLDTAACDAAQKAADAAGL